MMSIFGVVLGASNDTTITQTLLILGRIIFDGSYSGLQSPRELNILRGILAYSLIVNSVSRPSGSGTGHAALPVYRLSVNPLTRELFIVFCIAVLTWCTVVLAVCFFKDHHGPNISFFPELDFAAKTISVSSGGAPVELVGLGNGTSKDFKKRIQGKVLFVGASGSQGSSRAVIGTNPDLRELNVGVKYM